MLVSSSTSTLRRLIAASAFSAVLALGAGTAAAQDDHSGGVSPSTASRDQGATHAGAAGASRTSASGLPVTGSDVAGLALVGAASVAVGTAAVVASKRRQHLPS